MADNPFASMPPTISPQASSQAVPQGPAPGPQGPINMLSSPQGGGAPPQLPTQDQLIEALHKVGYLNHELKQLLSKPQLETKDILDGVGQAVGDQIMSPFMAAKYLSDLPPNADSLQLRQWVGQHYATTAVNLKKIGQMIAAEGAMRRRMQGQQAPMGAQPMQGAPPSPMGAAPPPPPNALAMPQQGAPPQMPSPMGQA